MPTRWIPWIKVLVHAVCLLPVLKLFSQYRWGELGLMADPVNWITHQTGYWTLFLLLASLAVTPVRRLHPRLGNLIRFRRLLGLYAFFYATLDRKSTRLNSSHLGISYAVFCLKKEH